MKALIITADDFGASPEVNEAVEKAHREGVLTAASLMVGAPAAADAVARAKRLPKLGVGLHLVLTEGVPVLSPRALPALTRGGEFRNDMVRMSFEMALFSGMREEIADEIEAQFKAFAATGLNLDHVDAHKHFHLHPAIAGMIFAIAPRYGLRAMRVPFEPREVLAPLEKRGGGALVRTWAGVLARRAAARGIWSPARTFGLCWSGAMTEERLAHLVSHAPEGAVSEIYLHPATGPYAGSTPGYRYGEELQALLSRRVSEIIDKNGVKRGPFGDFLPPASDAKLAPPEA